MISADTIRMAGTYVLAGMVLIGSFALLMFPSQVPPEQMLPFVTGITGIVLGWAFNRESTNAGSRASERSTSIGASAATPPNPPPFVPPNA
jgi:hypothetical protein